MDLSYEEKIEILGLSGRKKFVDALVDSLYDDYIEENKPKVVLNLLNRMLEQVGEKQVDELSKFKVVVADLKKIDGGTFVDENLDELKKVGIDPVEHLDYKLKDKRKKYILNVLKGLVNQVGYDVIKHLTKTKIEIGEYKNAYVYKLKNI